MEKYQLIAYIGRFHPAHKAHLATIRHALSLSERVLVLIGSAHHSMNIKHPFTYNQRVLMFQNCLTEAEIERVDFQPLKDSKHNLPQWISRVQDYIDVYDGKKAIIGYKKDNTSFYLNHFPQYDEIEMENIDDLNATDIRDILFGNKQFASLLCSEENDTLPRGVKDFLSDYMKTTDYQWMLEEYSTVKDIKDSWKGSPYTPLFVTGDNVVICAGHILLIQRSNHPGKGLWALPGGYVEADELIRDAAYRELKEETKIDVPTRLLKSKYKDDNTKCFDDVYRSDRGRIITHAWLIDLEPLSTHNKKGLPLIKKTEEAMDIKWFALNEFQDMEQLMFEDHYSLVNALLSRVK